MKDAETLQLVTRIKYDLTAAMKQQNQLEVATLKSLLASFSNAEAVETAHKSTTTQSVIAGASSGLGSTEAPRKNLTASDLATIIQAEIDELQQVIARLDKSNSYRLELEEKHAILERYQR